MRMGILLSLPVVSALLITFSFPSHDCGILAWFGLAPLLFALRQRGPTVAAGLALLFGYVFSMGAFSWALSTAEVNFPTFLLLLTALSLYFLAFGVLYRLISARIGSWIILGAPALWVALEYLRSHLFFLSFPWNLLAHSQYRSLPIIQIADITGVYGISFLLVLVNQVVSQIPELFSRDRPALLMTTRQPSAIPWATHLLTLGCVLVLTLVYGWYRLTAPASAQHLRVALIQANVLTQDNMPRPEQVEHLRIYERLTREAAREKPDLIVWPASSLPAPLNTSMFIPLTLSQLAHQTQSSLLVGGAGYQESPSDNEGYLPYSNSEFLISPVGRIEGQYNKIRLVPFNEYVPLQDTIRWPQWLTTLQDRFVPGEAYTLFQVSQVRFGAPICWENLFPDLFRRFVRDGAQFMVSVTNEGFFGHTAAPYQTLASNVFRAVENRVMIARAATTGVSCFINPNGEIVERITDTEGKDLFVSGVLVRDIALSNHKTFYTLYGDLFAYAVTCMAVSSVLASLFARLRARSRVRTCDAR